MMDTFRWFEVGGEVEYQLSPHHEKQSNQHEIRLTLGYFRTLNRKAFFVCSSTNV